MTKFSAGISKGRLNENLFNGHQCLIAIPAHQDPFAGGQSVSLDYPGLVFAIVKKVSGVGNRFKNGVVGRGDVSSTHDLLGEGLAAFQGSGFSRGAEGTQVIGLESVNQTIDQGGFGADDRQVDGGVFCETDQCRDVPMSRSTQVASAAMPALPVCRTPR
ncbi:MAG: hypothetical protein Ct9H300mP1_28270 [Planctomycetaceae bacterium]|nr:MAG: hypothetical protein Ct9H300mP1_28270 [Planctomycetaceae bacterium]